MAKNISVTIKFWKQNGPKDKGHFDTHELKNIPDDTSFLEALDIMNEELINEGKEPFVFDHDCREGICGMCSLYINGTPHGKTERGATTCQLYMRKFKDGETITVEPWRSAGFPVIRTVWLTATPSTRLCRQAVILPFVQVKLKMPTPSLFRKKMPTRRWIAPAASVVVLVWQHVRTALQCSSSARRSASLPFFHRVG